MKNKKLVTIVVIAGLIGPTMLNTTNTIAEAKTKQVIKKEKIKKSKSNKKKNLRSYSLRTTTPDPNTNNGQNFVTHEMYDGSKLNYFFGGTGGGQLDVPNVQLVTSDGSVIDHLFDPENIGTSSGLMFDGSQNTGWQNYFVMNKVQSDDSTGAVMVTGSYPNIHADAEIKMSPSVDNSAIVVTQKLTNNTSADIKTWAYRQLDTMVGTSDDVPIKFIGENRGLVIDNGEYQLYYHMKTEPNGPSHWGATPWTNIGLPEPNSIGSENANDAKGQIALTGVDTAIEMSWNNIDIPAGGSYEFSYAIGIQPSTTGQITVNYVDEDGKAIADPKLIGGPIDTPAVYDVPETIGDYSLKTAPEARNFSNEPQEVNAVYNKKEAKPVIIKYVDQDDSEIHDTDSVTGSLGDEFDVTDKKLEINGYSFKEVKGETKGKFGEDEQTVTFIYEKYVEPEVPSTPKAALVNVKYDDENGKEIADSDQLTGNIGDDYTAKAKNIEGYKLTSKESEFTSTFKASNDDVIFYYEKVKDKEQQVQDDTSVSSNKSLPQTGVEKINKIALATMGMSITSLLTAIGYLINKNRQQKKNVK